jgi:hypothetical protein
MNYLAPDLAIVPRQLIRSSLVIPIPVSLTVSVLLASSGITSTRSSFYSPKTSGLVNDKNYILSQASEAFDIISLRNISFVE